MNPFLRETISSAAYVYPPLTGYIIINPSEVNEPVQMVALSFVTSMLYLMVQPRPAPKDELKAAVGASPRYLDSERIAFLLL